MSCGPIVWAFTTIISDPVLLLVCVHVQSQGIACSLDTEVVLEMQKSLKCEYLLWCLALLVWGIFPEAGNSAGQPQHAVNL